MISQISDFKHLVEQKIINIVFYFVVGNDDHVIIKFSGTWKLMKKHFTIFRLFENVTF